MSKSTARDLAFQMAYLTAGAEHALNIGRITHRLKGDPDGHPALGGGHMDLVDNLVDCAEVVTKYLDGLPVGTDYPGVFEYEVTEEMGKWFVDQHTLTDTPTLDDFKDELHRQAAAFFSQPPL